MKATRQLQMAEEMRKEAVRYKGIEFTHKLIKPLLRRGPDMLANPPPAWRLTKGLRDTWKKITDSMPYQTGFAVDEGRLQGFATAPGSKLVWIRRQPIEGGMPKRELIAHEAFHARNPLLGHSEALARFYGGWKGAPKELSEFEKAMRGVAALKQYTDKDIHAYSPLLRWVNEKFPPTPKWRNEHS